MHPPIDSDINTIPEENLSLLRFFDSHVRNSIPELVPEKPSDKSDLDSSSEKTMLDVMGINSMEEPVAINSICAASPPAWVPVELTQHHSS